MTERADVNLWRVGQTRLVGGQEMTGKMVGMAYPSRPVLEVLPQFRGTASVRQTPEQRRRLIEYVTVEYQRGRSLRQLAELTGRTQTAVRRALDEVDVPRRGRGAQPLALARDDPGTTHELGPSMPSTSVTAVRVR